MTNPKMLTACLRWHAAHVRRLAIGAEQRRFVLVQKQRGELGGSSMEISRRLTAAKRIEQAALRNLAAICADVRGGQQQTTDTDVIDVQAVVLIS